ncbi:response regulator protein [Dinoroseobacter shibae DFL 12 = DSM 16493]|jgi:FixJ family two-component response regulator|uniref:Response regulator protein n=1 Tax=Dinoroseobacter shibae (strain DSM 16493 / NCIMB 14021 / DFL 12) TaxID=398580 RepID=A8LSV2_DINSH|nr:MULTISPECIES: response regulator [Dinoroseobacter]ABV94301.1 response regulator protein [Dinoroseobacter shibae DFL 12 = DSM 16493]MDD9717735.1 response regulator [Dinoroseobacter sp. PD6]URF45736.1 response regulator [Dinoroseobacter shibae]URF50041.1 response regulator [Dinoroseobacter shibae]
MSESELQEPCVFLVDDDADIRASLSRALGLRGYTVKTFASAHEFLGTYDGSASGCLILDYGMPTMNGLELQAYLKAAGIDVPIIFITGHGGVPESVQAMKMGAIDFLEKPFKQSILIERIDAAFEADAKRREVNQHQSEIVARYQGLTSREQEIALIIATNPARNSSKDVARTLGISPRTVDHHRARILEKMDVRTVAELVEAALKADLFKTDP